MQIVLDQKAAKVADKADVVDITKLLIDDISDKEFLQQEDLLDAAVPLKATNDWKVQQKGASEITSQLSQ